MSLAWLLADALWREMVVAGRALAAEPPDTPAKVPSFAAEVLLLWHEQGAPARLARFIPGRDGAVDLDEHQNIAERDVYLQVLLRRVRLTNAGGADGRADLTNCHRLLASLLPYVVGAATPALTRYPVATHRNGPANHLAPFFERLRQAWDHEQDRHAQAQRTGKRWGFLANSPSPSWIDKAGPLHLDLDGWCGAVPEEIGLQEVFTLLRDRPDPRLAEEWRQGIAMIGALDSHSAISKAEAALGAALPAGYQAYILFRDLVEALHRPYGQVVAAGLPSALAFDLDPEFNQKFTSAELDFLISLRKAADLNKAARSAIGRELQDWELAWKAARDMPKKYRDIGFRGFCAGDEGRALLNLRHQEPVATSRALSPEAALRRLRETGGMTATERRLLDACFDLADDNNKRSSVFGDPELIREVTALAAGEVPYRLIPADRDRLAVAKFFFERRLALVSDGAIAWVRGRLRAADDEPSLPAPTAAEERVLAIVREESARAGFPVAEAGYGLQVAILDRLDRDAELARYLATAPYQGVPEKHRLKLMLYFYTRDIESRLSRTA